MGGQSVGENEQCRRAGRPLSKIHRHKVIHKKLLGEIPAKNYGRVRTEI